MTVPYALRVLSMQGPPVEASRRLSAPDAAIARRRAWPGGRRRTDPRRYRRPPVVGSRGAVERDLEAGDVSRPDRLPRCGGDPVDLVRASHHGQACGHASVRPDRNSSAVVGDHSTVVHWQGIDGQRREHDDEITGFAAADVAQLEVHDGAYVIRREDDRRIADLAGDGPSSAHQEARGDGKNEDTEARRDGLASPGLEHG